MKAAHSAQVSMFYIKTTKKLTRSVEKKLFQFLTNKDWTSSDYKLANVTLRA